MPGQCGDRAAVRRSARKHLRGRGHPLGKCNVSESTPQLSLYATEEALACNSTEKEKLFIVCNTEREAHQLRLLKVVPQVTFPSAHACLCAQLTGERCKIFAGGVGGSTLCRGLADLPGTHVQLMRRTATETRNDTICGYISGPTEVPVWSEVRPSLAFICIQTIDSFSLYYLLIFLIVLCAGLSKLCRPHKDSKAG